MSAGEEFSLTHRLGLTPARGKEIEKWVIDSMNKTGSVRITLDKALKRPRIGKSALKPNEKEFLLILLGIYIRINQERHEQNLLHNPEYGISNPEDDDDDI